MNRTKRLLFSMLTLLCCCTGVWALDQDSSDGYYKIGTVQDWQDFANGINNGTIAISANAKMIADVNLGDNQTHIGPLAQQKADTQSYSGTFDGQGHTLTVAYTGSGEQVVAPFTHVSGATIKNLHVDGTIHSTFAFNGLVGLAGGTGNLTISNVWLSVKISSTQRDWSWCGAFIGCIWGSVSASIKDCLFTGSLTCISGTTANGCFAYNYTGSARITNCLSTGTFRYGGGVSFCNDNKVTHTNCYVKQFAGTIPDAMQLTDAQLTDGTITTALQAGALQAGREEMVWVQDPLTNQPMLKTFATAAYTVPSSGIGTFSAKAKFTVPDGLTAYYCKEYNSENRTIGVVAVDGVVPANTGVVLRGTAGETYTLTGTNSEAATITDNALVAVTEATHVNQIDGQYTNFMMSGGMFVKIEASSDANVKMPANRAYLQILTSALPTAGARSVVLDWDDDATGVQAVRDSRPAVDGYYNLAGQRVAHPTKGLYIVGGRKVVIK